MDHLLREAIEECLAGGDRNLHFHVPTRDSHPACLAAAREGIRQVNRNLSPGDMVRIRILRCPQGCLHIDMEW